MHCYVEHNWASRDLGLNSNTLSYTYRWSLGSGHWPLDTVPTFAKESPPGTPSPHHYNGQGCIPGG